MAIRIITDSPSDISIKEAKQLNIDIVPLKINIGDKSYQEGIDITIEEFYEKLKTSEVLPTTSQPSPDDYVTLYEEAKKAGDDVIVITLASKLSGTYQSANLAKGIVDYPNIHIIDSEQATLGEMLLVKYAVKLRDQGKTTEEIVEIITEAKKKVVLVALIDTLEYLQKGGRLSKGAAIAGSLLNIKPVITVQDGEVAVISKARGVKAGIRNLLSSIDDFEDFNLDAPVTYGFSGIYSEHIKQAEAIKEKIVEKYSLEDVGTFSIGSVIGTHAGPGAYGFAFLQK